MVWGPSRCRWGFIIGPAARWGNRGFMPDPGGRAGYGSMHLCQCSCPALLSPPCPPKIAWTAGDGPVAAHRPDQAQNPDFKAASCAGVVPARPADPRFSRRGRRLGLTTSLGVALHSNNAKRRRLEHTSALAPAVAGRREAGSRSPAARWTAAGQRGCRIGTARRGATWYSGWADG